MVSQKEILKLVQTILNELDKLRQEFKVQTVQLTLAHTEIRQLKASQEAMRLEFQENSRVTLHISETLIDVQTKITSLATVTSSPGLHEVVDTLDLKLKSYAEATKVAHISFCQEQEVESANQYSRRNNVKISGLPEAEDEDVNSVVTKFLVDTLHVHTPDLVQAFRIGKTSTKPRAIIAKFVNRSQRYTAMANKFILKG